MRELEVRVDSAAPRERQLAWWIAETAADTAAIDDDVAAIVVNRVIDDAAVATAAVKRAPVAAARAQALAHPRAKGATVHGMSADIRVDCEWAAYCNATAVRELDFHDSFFGAESCHPGDCIPAIVAAAQQCECTGADVIRGIATAYEVQIALAGGIPLQRFKLDHMGHFGPAVAAGLGALLRLPAEVIFEAVEYAAHVSFYPRQGRKGALSSWKASAPGLVGKLAIEAVDRAMRGETSPTPAYEGDQGILTTFLGGDEAAFAVRLPDRGEPKRAILRSYTKAYSAGYHSQSAIDLAFRLRKHIPDWEAVESVELHVHRRAHRVMGSGANDPEKWHPEASRETLDHSLPYIFAVALQDGDWHHQHSYAPQRARRGDTVALWRKVSTVEDPEWTRRYDGQDGLLRDHGCRAVIRLKDGREIADEIAVADAHPRGAAPFARADYEGKFLRLSEGLLPDGEAERFLEMVRTLPGAQAADLAGLVVQVEPRFLASADERQGIF